MALGVFMVPFVMPLDFFHSHKGKETDRVNITDRYNLFLLIQSMLSCQGNGWQVGGTEGRK